jgi:Tol biopolymer transport system component
MDEYTDVGLSGERLKVYTRSALLLFYTCLAICATLSALTCTNEQGGIMVPPTILPAGQSDWGPDNWIVFVYQPWYISGDETLYVEESSALWLIRPDGKGLHSIGEPETPDGVWIGDKPQWGPDGNWIAVNDILGRIWLISADGDSLAQITTEGKKLYPSFSPDGNKLAFSTPDSDAIGPRGVRILDLETKEEKFVYPYGIDPSWSPDGEKLVFWGWVLEGGQWIGGTGGSVVTVDTTGENAHVIHLDETGGGIESPSFSPDGFKILYREPYAWGGGIGQIWVVDVDGSDAKKLTTEGGRWPSWSPDGSKIVYTKYSLEDPCQVGSGELYVMNADGSAKSRITFFNFEGEKGGVDE